MTFDRRRFLTAAVALAALGPISASASLPPADAEAFVEKLVQDLIAILRTADARNTRVEEFLALFRRTTALEDIGRFTMGLNWRAMSDAQKRAFLDAFERYAARAYTNRLGEYTGQTVEVTGSQDVGRRGVLVRSVLKSPDAADVAVEWLVSEKDGAPMLVDIVAEGVSISITQREEFAAMVERRGGDIDRFIADLEQLG
jgi:phospholipid transport system substrate-binding protein